MFGQAAILLFFLRVVLLEMALIEVFSHVFLKKAMCSVVSMVGYGWWRRWKAWRREGIGVSGGMMSVSGNVGRVHVRGALVWKIIANNN